MKWKRRVNQMTDTRSKEKLNPAKLSQAFIMLLSRSIRVGIFTSPWSLVKTSFSSESVSEFRTRTRSYLLKYEFRSLSVVIH